MPELEECETRIEPRPTPEAEEVYLRWINNLDEEFARHHKPALRAEIVRVQLHQLFLSRPSGGKLNFTLTTELPTNIFQLSLDSSNITLCAEYSDELDRQKYDERKPLIWFLANVRPLSRWLEPLAGIPLPRHARTPHLSEHRQKCRTIYPGMSLTFGYNVTIEDDCILHENVTLDDRSPITIPKGTSVAAGSTFGGDGTD